MSLRSKSFITIFFGTLFSFFILIFLSYFFILKEFEKLEISDLKIKINQLQQIFKSDLEKLANITGDWAIWDDTYNFVKNKNQRYIKTNLTNETFSQTKWHFVIFLNEKREVIYKKGYDFFLKKEIPVYDKEIIEKLKEDNRFSQVLNYDDEVIEFIKINNQLAVVCLKPILKSDGSGPLGGYFITGYFFDEYIRKKLTERFRNDVLIIPYDHALIEFNELLPEIVLKENDFFVFKQGLSRFVNYLTIKDSQKPVFVFKFYFNRLVFLQGLKTVFSFLLVYFAIIGLLVLFYYHFIYLFIIKRLEKILTKVKEIDEKKDFSLRINDGVKDEFGVLARNFDQLLNNLTETQKKEKEKSTQLEKQNKELEDIKKALFNVLEDEREARENIEKKVKERTKELSILNQKLNENWLRLQFSIESLPLGFILINNDRQIILANQKIREILGIGKNEELTCEKIIKMFSGKIDLFSSCRLASLQKDVVEINEVELEDKILKIKFIPVLDNKNQVINTIFLVEDVTKERIMQRQIEDLNLHLEEKVKEKTKQIEKNLIDLKKFKLAVEEANDIIVITDREKKVLFVNLATTLITGFEKKELLGKKITDFLLMNVKESKKIDELFKKAEEEKTSLILESLNKRKNGSSYIVELHISPIFDKKGRLIYYVFLGRDVTKEKEIDQMKSDFISLASHQLKTPLSTIRWFLDLLLGGDLGSFSKKQVEILKDIDKANKVMIEIVDSLLNISRIESGRLIVEPVLTDVRKIIDEVKEEVFEKLKEKKQTLEVIVEKEVPRILVDPKFLREVYVNLITNAIKYSPSSTKIKIIVKKENDYILNIVKDYGFGIPKEEQKKIFTKFFRGSNVVKKVTEGTGLGLYLTKIIVEKAGGKIWFESEEGKGTTFYFTLPLSGMKKKEAKSI